MTPNIIPLYAIHRGRNYHTNILIRNVTPYDINFDYRKKSRLLLLIKAFITATEVPPCQWVLVDGGLSLFVGIIKSVLCGSKVLLISTEKFFVPERFSSKTLYSKAKRRVFSKYVDRIVTLSKMCQQDAQICFPDKKVETCHYFIDGQVLAKRRPFCRNNNVYFIIARPADTGQIKGLDIAIEVAKICAVEMPHLHFHFIGAGTEDIDCDLPNGTKHGFVAEMDILVNGGVVLSTSRYDAFNLSIVESVMLGCIPVVSAKTGSKEVLEEAACHHMIAKTSVPMEYVKILKEIDQSDDARLIRDHEKIQTVVEKLTKQKSLARLKEIVSTLPYQLVDK